MTLTHATPGLIEWSMGSGKTVDKRKIRAQSAKWRPSKMWEVNPGFDASAKPRKAAKWRLTASLSNEEALPVEAKPAVEASPPIHSAALINHLMTLGATGANNPMLFGMQNTMMLSTPMLQLQVSSQTLAIATMIEANLRSARLSSALPAPAPVPAATSTVPPVILAARPVRSLGKRARASSEAVGEAAQVLKMMAASSSDHSVSSEEEDDTEDLTVAEYLEESDCEKCMGPSPALALLAACGAADRAAT
jgi:hypothetical protein